MTKLFGSSDLQPVARKRALSGRRIAVITKQARRRRAFFHSLRAPREPHTRPQKKVFKTKPAKPAASPR